MSQTDRMVSDLSRTTLWKDASSRKLPDHMIYAKPELMSRKLLFTQAHCQSFWQQELGVACSRFQCHQWSHGGVHDSSCWSFLIQRGHEDGCGSISQSKGHYCFEERSILAQLRACFSPSNSLIHHQEWRAESVQDQE